MARLIALVSLILFTVLALAGPLDLLVAERPVAKRSIQHAPLQNVEARAPKDGEVHVLVVKTKTHYSYVTTTVAATKTVDHNQKHAKATTTVTITGYGASTTTLTETETCYETATVTVPQYGCTTTTTEPTVSVMPRHLSHKRAQGNQALYAREFA